MLAAFSASSLMSGSACAKCRRGSQAEGDSWCAGYLALEGALTSLRSNWWSVNHRRLGEEVLVSAARQLRSIKNLDTSLQSFSDSWEAKLKKAQSSGIARPSEPKGPPRSRPQLTEATRAPLVKEERAESVHHQRTGTVQPDSPGSSVDYRGGRSPTPSGPEEGPESPSPRREDPHPSGGAASGHLGSREHPPRSRSPQHRGQRKRGPRPGHRGGVKHQKHYRNLPTYQDTSRDHWPRHRGPHPPRGVIEEDL